MVVFAKYNAKKVFNGSNKIFFSCLLNMEILSAIRSAMSCKYSNISDLEDNSKDLYRKIISNTVKQDSYDMEDSSDMHKLDSNNLFQQAININKKIEGEIENQTFCRKCNNKFLQTVYTSINLVDIMHVVIAKEFGCKKFITFDKGFNEIRGYNEIEPMKIEIL